MDSGSPSTWHLLAGKHLHALARLTSGAARPAFLASWSSRCLRRSSAEAMAFSCWLENQERCTARYSSHVQPVGASAPGASVRATSTAVGGCEGSHSCNHTQAPSTGGRGAGGRRRCGMRCVVTSRLAHVTVIDA